MKVGFFSFGDTDDCLGHGHGPFSPFGPMFSEHDHNPGIRTGLFHDVHFRFRITGELVDGDHGGYAKFPDILNMP